MTKITPGPWGVFNQTDVFTNYDGALDGYHIADCNVHYPTTNEYPEMDYEQQKANTQAIAAVPDMIEALREIANHSIESYGNAKNMQNIAKQALAIVED